MLIAYEWLNEYFHEDLPPPHEVADTLTMHAYEVEEIYKKGEYTLLDIDVLPNRAADSLSHRGVAREVSTLLKLDMEDTYPKPDVDTEITSGEYINLSIQSDNVRRATKRLVTDVSVEESNEEIRKKLQALGHQPINNVVDATNYIMLATGQPVHAFDYDKLAGDAPKDIVIREAKAGETITTLDGKEHTLQEGMLVIADEKKPLDIAGIKGGMNSHIDEDTERIMLSVCSFDPTKIRTASQALNLRTDAGKRFENDISPELPKMAMNYLSALVQEHAGANIGADILDAYSQKANEYVTGVSVRRVNDLLGTDISTEEATRILERCWCAVTEVAPNEAVANAAADYVGAEYELGASVRFDAPEVFDCSSLVAYIFAHHGGLSIPRMTVDQYVYGAPVDVDAKQPGDVVFANTGEGDIHYESKEYMPGTEVPEGVDHCGIYLGDGQVIHTNTDAKVVIDQLDESSQFT
ncbi:MAG: hypothetical protein BRC24_02095, partial [Parcubacteria group bacterium SW_4_46_8]